MPIARVVGVDENGLGPQLGPLVVTAAVLDLDRYDALALRRVAEPIGITDSKEVGGFGDMETCESIALAALGAIGARTDTFDALLDSIAARPVAALKSICPKDAPAAIEACWTPALALPAFGGDPAAVRLPAELRLVEIRSEVFCAGAIHAAAAAGKTKFDLDVRAMESLVIGARERAAGEIWAICGKVGGMKYYRDPLGPLGDLLATTVEESPNRSDYRIAGFGRLVFEVDADASHVPVALASIVGKYVRECFVERLNRFYGARVRSLSPASGYHDPVSDAFVRRTVRIRKKLAVPDDCFER